MCILCFPEQKLRNANFRLDVHCALLCFLWLSNRIRLIASCMKCGGKRNEKSRCIVALALGTWARAVRQIDVYSCKCHRS